MDEYEAYQNQNDFPSAFNTVDLSGNLVGDDYKVTIDDHYKQLSKEILNK